jgi:AP-2 complex subunit alpha
VLHTGEGGKFGCLLRLEPNYSTQVSSPLFHLLLVATLTAIPRWSVSRSVPQMRVFHRS